MTAQISMTFLSRAIVVISSVVTMCPVLADDLTDPPLTTQTGEQHDQKISFWLETSLSRVFPHSAPGSTDLELLAPRHSRNSFQVCVRNDGEQVAQVSCKVVGADDLAPLVRFVGLTPVRHVTLGTPLRELDGGGKFVPGLVPDVLWPKTTADIGPFESRSFWVTLTIPKEISAGGRAFRVRLSLKDSEAEAVELPVRLTVAPLVLQRRSEFPVTHWWWPQSNWDYYKTEMFDDDWWRITRAQMENMLAHGSDVVYVPLLSFAFPQVFERPSQMLIVREAVPGKYQFDWSRVKRFTDMCREVGFRQFEWSHLFRQWTVAGPPLIYKLENGKYVSLWPVDEPLLSPKYTNLMQQLLPEFKAFLDKERLLDQSYFHLADEPQSIDNYSAAREFLRREAPWMKVMDAVQDVRIAQQKLTDMPIPLINVAQAYREKNIPHWVYFCCIPTGEYLNRFMDTPLPKIRMAGWTFYRLRAQGFLHWGYNYWNRLDDVRPVDPFVDPTAGGAPGIPAGDPYVIYPGPDGKPLDSIRWEVFAESLQDYALLQSAGISPDDELLEPIRSYADFPKTEKWLNDTRQLILLGPQRHPTADDSAD